MELLGITCACKRAIAGRSVKYRCKLELAHNEVRFNNAFDLNRNVMKIITSPAGPLELMVGNPGTSPAHLSASLLSPSSFRASDTRARTSEATTTTKTKATTTTTRTNLSKVLAQNTQRRRGSRACFGCFVLQRQTPRRWSVHHRDDLFCAPPWKMTGAHVPILSFFRISRESSRRNIFGHFRCVCALYSLYSSRIREPGFHNVTFGNY